MEKILSDIVEERKYQKEKWGTEADLKINTPMDFVGYIAHHSTRWFPGGFRPYSAATLGDFRQEMIKVATLAVAAIEATDAIMGGEVSRPDVLAN